MHFAANCINTRFSDTFIISLYYMRWWWRQISCPSIVPKYTHTQTHVLLYTFKQIYTHYMYNYTGASSKYVHCMCAFALHFVARRIIGSKWTHTYVMDARKQDVCCYFGKTQEEIIQSSNNEKRLLLVYAAHVIYQFAARTSLKFCAGRVHLCAFKYATLQFAYIRMCVCCVCAMCCERQNITFSLFGNYRTLMLMMMGCLYSGEHRNIYNIKLFGLN